MSITTYSIALADLADRLDGDLTLPGDQGWDDARRAWQLVVDQHPIAVVHAESIEDVIATLAVAARTGLRVAPQGPGHNAGPLGALDDTILLRTTRMREVTIDATRMIARVDAGAVWSDVVAAAAQSGLAALAGSAPSVGVVGYTLGGGIGWLARSHGLAANSVTAIDIVDGMGRPRRVDAEHEPDLFWALRGAGGDVAIVTSIEFRLYPISEVYAGALMWPIDRAADIAETWRRWVCDVPASVTSVCRVLRYPPLPELPPILQGRAFVSVELTIQEGAGAGEQMVAALRERGPEIDTVAMMPVAQLGMLHGDPPTPVPAFGEAVLLAELDAECMDAFVGCATADAASPLLSIELRHLGGELAPGRGEGGAVDSLAGDALLFAVGIAPTPEAGVAVRSAASRVVEAVDRWRSSRALSNFAEQPTDPEALFGGAVERLRRIKAESDPMGLIRSNHPIG